MRAIHFWIGANCDSTVSGAAALRAAELDSQTSAMILTREAQGRESPRFLAYFRQRLVVENLHHEPPGCALHRVSGVAVPILTELERVHWERFSCRDVILVDVRAKCVTVQGNRVPRDANNFCATDRTMSKSAGESFPRVKKYTLPRTG